MRSPAKGGRSVEPFVLGNRHHRIGPTFEATVTIAAIYADEALDRMISVIRAFPSIVMKRWCSFKWVLPVYVHTLGLKSSRRAMHVSSSSHARLSASASVMHASVLPGSPVFASLWSSCCGVIAVFEVAPAFAGSCWVCRNWKRTGRSTGHTSGGSVTSNVSFIRPGTIEGGG